MSATQDVVQQLILRLIHFLLNCPQTRNATGAANVGPKPCSSHRRLRAKSHAAAEDTEQLLCSMAS